MPEEPPNIDSDGEQPTNFGERPPERDSTPEQGASKPERPEKPGPPPSDFHISPSDGELDTYRVEQRLSQFVSSGTELPPELVEEQKSVLLQPGDMVADRFEVVKQLGFGGMGAVYHVKDRITKQSRALKVMLSSLLESEGAQERFVSEVTISQKLAHEGVVRVYDIGEDPSRGIRFFTMELVEGKTLNRLLKERGGKLPLDEALDIVRQLCDALEYAHRYTVHRDLKPQNVMVRPDGSVKVLDFGLAKLMSPGRMTRSSMALGTAYYQAPEQSVHLSELDQRADIYSVGVILYQMLTGEIPVGRVKAPSELNSEVYPPLDDMVLKCIEPKPAERYASARELWTALENTRTSIEGARQGDKEEARKKAAATPSAGATKTVDLGGGVSMELVWIPPGEFRMGSEDGLDDEKPVHKVRIPQGFWMGKYEVTQAQWQAVTGNNPSKFKGDRNPVETVSWNDCQEFVKKLSQRAGVA
ncbi:MAG: bifunctional serine/threonine-protein kinase/formylglycine-generating enzyme family protein, partial [Candidatus Hydrogenedentota bacterium]